MNESVPHPLLGCLGCRVGHGNGPVETQARNFLLSLRNATIQQIAGRLGPDLTAEQFREWMLKLEEWQKHNTVPLPPPLFPAGHRYVPPAKPIDTKPQPSPQNVNVQDRWPELSSNTKH